jgi:hypothetical protein
VTTFEITADIQMAGPQPEWCLTVCLRNKYILSLAQVRKFKEKGKYEARPVAQQQGNKWCY